MPTIDNQMARYLNEPRRRAEVNAALCALWFAGVNLYFSQAYGDPLRWAGGTEHQHFLLNLSVLIACMVHSLGIWMNGRWKHGVYSTALRMMAMAYLCGVAGTMSISGFIAHNSAFAIYPPCVFYFFQGARAAFNDWRMAVNGYRYD
ncbi:hypothetical protein [Marivivens aquimaris]|uniref:hypothetical protein n=1 Tax=Marivivens aquimaris TaxID=2774876 RepID=UPI001881A598|nr:hypothetical protein [Marivivens aquimaris]